MSSRRPKVRSKYIGEIEMGRPVEKVGGKKGLSKYPFKEMNIGASFVVQLPSGPCDPQFSEKHHKLAQTVRAAARRYGKKLGKKFIVRRIDEGVRCHRVE